MMKVIKKIKNLNFLYFKQSLKFLIYLIHYYFSWKIPNFATFKSICKLNIYLARLKNKIYKNFA